MSTDYRPLSNVSLTFTSRLYNSAATLAAFGGTHGTRYRHRVRRVGIRRASGRPGPGPDRRPYPRGMPPDRRGAPLQDNGRCRPGCACCRQYQDSASIAAAVEGADTVVNLVGILYERGRQTFDAVHRDGAAAIAREAARAGVRRLIHVSAIGADPDADAAYARSKGEGEAAVREAFPEAVILRPSIIFGPEDGFFQPVCGHGAAVTGPAADRRRSHKVSAGLCRRRGSCRRPQHGEFICGRSHLRTRRTPHLQFPGTA